MHHKYGEYLSPNLHLSTIGRILWISNRLREISYAGITALSIGFGQQRVGEQHNFFQPVYRLADPFLKLCLPTWRIANKSKGKIGMKKVFVIVLLGLMVAGTITSCAPQKHSCMATKIGNHR